MIPLATLLPSLPAITLTPEGRVAGRPGRVHRAVAREQAPEGLPGAGRVRLLHPDGHLVAIAEPRAGGDSAGASFFASRRGTGIKYSFGTNTLRRTGERHPVTGRWRSAGPHAEVSIRGTE